MHSADSPRPAESVLQQATSVGFMQPEDGNLRNDKNGFRNYWRARDKVGSAKMRSCLKNFGWREMSAPCFSQPDGGLGRSR